MTFVIASWLQLGPLVGQDQRSGARGSYVHYVLCVCVRMLPCCKNGLYTLGVDDAPELFVGIMTHYVTYTPYSSNMWLQELLPLQLG